MTNLCAIRLRPTREKRNMSMAPFFKIIFQSIQKVVVREMPSCLEFQPMIWADSVSALVFHAIFLSIFQEEVDWYEICLFQTQAGLVPGTAPDAVSSSPDQGTDRSCCSTF
jgi:hypothetical protein